MQLEPEIQLEYERVLRLLDPTEPVTSLTLSSADVLRAHFLIANQFLLDGEGLGGLGPRSVNLLQSAVFRQHTSFRGLPKWKSPYEVCATLFYGLIMNHAFHDANKRTSFLCALWLLQQHRICPSVDQKVFEDFTVEIADNKLGQYDRYKRLKRENHPDPEVAYIAYFLRANTRPIDKTDYTVTFRELDTLLRRFGCGLENPNNNHIDIHKKKMVAKVERNFFGLTKKVYEVEEYVKLGQVGFPRWTAPVGRAALKTVRSVTELDYANGVDSAAFFKGLDPVQQLITSYHEPLRRLAFR